MADYKNQKLELTWIGKDNQPKLEPRILIEDPEKSYGHTPRPSQEGNKHTPNPLSRGEYKSPLLGGDSGVGNIAYPRRQSPCAESPGTRFCG